MKRSGLVIGSRGSALAMWQSEAMARAIEAAHPGLECRIDVIKTTGDVMVEASLVAIAGKGVFTKEIEDAMLDGRVDIAVHSLKDLPTTLPPGLELGAITKREDPRDAFCARPGVSSVVDLPEGARIGTSSPRRRAQLLAWRPDLELVDLRGNVDTRLRKIESEGLDGIILACAGLRRLGLADRITEALGVNVMVPAVGQGALGIEIREGDADVRGIVEALADAETTAACRAERAFLHAVGGGCAVPIAAHAWPDGEGQLSMVGSIATDADRPPVRGMLTGSMREPERLGQSLAAVCAR